jgi:amino acid transporter/nucleotide-binding universal stress UspA family protein
MLVTDSRPRNLKWYHAGPLLFGDWGTSRLYVLGLAFYYTGHASPLYLALMSLIMIVVAWAYTVVCRCFPDGGGVYAAARPLSHTLSAVAATLLLCGYIVTAALSVVEGYHYFGIRADLVVLLSVITIAVIGVINWLGARSAGRFALITAIAAVIMSAFIGVLCIPMAIEGASAATATVPGVDTTWDRWESLVRIVLALAGVEAVANMTGLMRPPVRRTAKRTIWPVLIEVVALNLLFGLALNALPQLKPYTVPDYVTFEQGMNQLGPAGEPIRFEPQDVPDEVKQYRDTAVKVLATHAAGEALGAPTGRIFGIMSGIIFGLLLMSAVNTAVMAMVSVLFSLAQDKELPRAFTRLNYSGVPWIGLLVACALPVAMLIFIGSDAKMLGELYAVGVVGAISINVLSCAFNKSLSIGRFERACMWALGGLMAAIELTIIVAKPRATIFAGSIIATVLIIRFFLKRRAEAEVPPLPTPEAGWLAEVRRAPVVIEPGKPRIMLAARGRYQSEFAVDLARRRGAVLFAIYVRTLRVMDVQPGAVPRVEDDPIAQETLGTTAILAREAGVPFVPIYVTSTDIPAEILDYTVTYGCDTLIMGKSRRSLFSRRVTGDVVAEIARHLPDNVALITRATDAPFVPGHPRADE